MEIRKNICNGLVDIGAVRSLAIRGRNSAEQIFYLAGLRREEREDPTVHGGDESGALCPNIKNYKSNKGATCLITCTAL